MSSISPKVYASTLAAAIVTILVWIASSAGIDVPSAVIVAVTTIVTFAAGYLKLDSKRV